MLEKTGDLRQPQVAATSVAQATPATEVAATSGTTSAAEAPSNYLGLALALAVLGQGIDSASSSWISPLAPFLQADLNISRAQIGLVPSAMRLGAVTAMMAGGRAVDVFGVRRTLTVSLLAAGILLVFWDVKRG